MADSILVSLTAQSITKVATNVTTGTIHFVDDPAQYFYDYRQTGEPAPANLSTAVQASSKSASIQASAGIDVYVYALKALNIIVSV